MPLPFFSEKCVSLRKYVYSNSCHQRSPFPVPRISTISFDPMSLTSLQISPRYQRKPSILLSLIQQATLTEFFPVYSELTLFWIKICILPRYCKKRFIFTSCYRAAVKQMTRRKRDFFLVNWRGCGLRKWWDRRLPIQEPTLIDLQDKKWLNMKISSSKP